MGVHCRLVSAVWGNYGTGANQNQHDLHCKQSTTIETQPRCPIVQVMWSISRLGNSVDHLSKVLVEFHFKHMQSIRRLLIQGSMHTHHMFCLPTSGMAMGHGNSALEEFWHTELCHRTGGCARAYASAPKRKRRGACSRSRSNVEQGACAASHTSARVGRVPGPGDCLRPGPRAGFHFSIIFRSGCQDRLRRSHRPNYRCSSDRGCELKGVRLGCSRKYWTARGRETGNVETGPVMCSRLLSL